MKVNNNGAKSTSTTTSVRAKELENSLKSNGKDKADSAAATFESTKIKMSPEAQQLSKAKAIASADTVDEAKVARIQKLIDEGKYKIDSAAVADRLVDEHLLTGE